MGVFDVMGAAKRGGLRGLGQAAPNGGYTVDTTNPSTLIPRSECPKCDGCHWIFYVGTAAGGIGLLALALKVLSGD